MDLFHCLNPTVALVHYSRKRIRLTFFVDLTCSSPGWSSLSSLSAVLWVWIHKSHIQSSFLAEAPVLFVGGSHRFFQVLSWFGGWVFPLKPLKVFNFQQIRKRTEVCWTQRSEQERHRVPQFSTHTADGCDIHFAPLKETMGVGICRGNRIIPGLLNKWCEMDFVLAEYLG